MQCCMRHGTQRVVKPEAKRVYRNRDFNQEECGYSQRNVGQDFEPFRCIRAFRRLTAFTKESIREIGKDACCVYYNLVAIQVSILLTSNRNGHTNKMTNWWRRLCSSTLANFSCENANLPTLLSLSLPCGWYSGRRGCCSDISYFRVLVHGV